MSELSAVPQSSRDAALDRFRLLRPYLEGERPLREVASAANIPYRTALRWVVAYRKSGLKALTRRPRADDGQRRVLSPRLIEAIEALALERPPLPISSGTRQAGEIAGVLGEPAPNYSAVRRTIRKLPAGLLTLAHEGAKVYTESFDLIHRREALKPNAVWQADHAQLDILLVREDGSTGLPC